MIKNFYAIYMDYMYNNPNFLKPFAFCICPFLIYLIVIGAIKLKQCTIDKWNPRSITIYRLFVIPFIISIFFLEWGLYSLFYFVVSLNDFALCLLSIVIGILAQLAEKIIQKKYYPNVISTKKALFIRTLIFLFIQNLGRYVYIKNIFEFDSYGLHNADIIFFGIFTGTFMATTVNLIKKYVVNHECC